MLHKCTQIFKPFSNEAFYISTIYKAMYARFKCTIMCRNLSFFRQSHVQRFSSTIKHVVKMSSGCSYTKLLGTALG